MEATTMPMTATKGAIRPDEDDFGGFGKLSLPLLDVDDCLAAVEQAARSCKKLQSYDSAVQACESTRTAWMAIHQRFLSNPSQLTSIHYREAVLGMRECLAALEKVSYFKGEEPIEILQRRVREQFPEGIQLRIELVTTLETKGLDAVNQRIKKFIACRKGTS
jgi:hypothetical protein